MQAPIDLQQFAELLRALYGLMRVGVGVSVLGLFGVHVTRWLSNYGVAESPDPTILFRLWRGFYEQYFHPIGEQAATHPRLPGPPSVVYQVAVGGIAMVAAVATYLSLSSATLGTMIVSYHAGYTPPNLSSGITTIAAVCILFGLSVTFYSVEQSQKIE